MLDELVALEHRGDADIDLGEMPEVTDWGCAERGRLYGLPAMSAAAAVRVPLPAAVTRIYEATRELESIYPSRKFTPDGHLVGSIGEVIAAKALGLTLSPMSRAGHDARDREGRDVQIKMTAGSSVAMYDTSERLVVLRVVSPQEAEIVYDGPGKPAWDAARPMAKNGQRVVSLAKLRRIAAGSAA